MYVQRFSTAEPFNHQQRRHSSSGTEAISRSANNESPANTVSVRARSYSNGELATGTRPETAEDNISLVPLNEVDQLIENQKIFMFSVWPN